MCAWRCCSAEVLCVQVLLWAQVALENMNFTVLGKMYGAVMHMDKALLLRLFRDAVLLAVGKSLLYPMSLYVQWETGFDCAIQVRDAPHVPPNVVAMRIRLDVAGDVFARAPAQVENNIVDRYMANDNFYKLAQIDQRIKDPEQRICEDIFASVFGFWSTILFNTALPICKLTFFTYRVGAIMGHKWSLSILLFLAMNTAVIKYTMPNYRKMYSDLSNQEGKFKKIHARVKLCSESIGFFGGGDREKQMVNERFDKYMEQDW